MPRKPRTSHGMITLVVPRLRIVNGDIDSLRRMKPVGRPKKTENIPTQSIPPTYARKSELADMNVRDGFQYVRSLQRESRITEKRIEMEDKYNRLCEQQARLVERFQSVQKQNKELVEYFDNDAEVWVSERREPVHRVERSVPSSLCSCKKRKNRKQEAPSGSNENDWNSDDMDSASPCLVHGMKQADCDCGGINGSTGYRTCAGHRSSQHTPGIRKDLDVLASANAKLKAAEA